MFNRHQAEITVMQFRGYSLPVHHSVVYHGNYFVPFHQPISTHAISSSNCHWNVSLPSGASPWNSIFLGWVEGQNITHPYCSINMTAAWKKLRFIFSVTSDFHTTNSLLIAVHAFVSCVSMSKKDGRESSYC